VFLKENAYFIGLLFFLKRWPEEYLIIIKKKKILFLPYLIYKSVQNKD
jgi:hypothetical protein